MPSVAVVGNLALDLVDGAPARVGGAPFHSARALRTLTQPARVVTKCAQADRPLLLPPLVALGVPVTWRPAAATSSFSIVYRGDERLMEVDAVGASWSPEEARGWVREALGASEWVHVAPLLRSDFPPETLAELALGRRLSLDGQGLVRRAATGRLELDRDFDPAALAHVSVLKLAEEEALTLVGGLDRTALAALGVPEIVVTLGSRGCLVLVEGRSERVPAVPVPGSADPTGAGDAFIAAYLAARSAGGAPAASARRATALVAELLSGKAG